VGLIEHLLVLLNNVVAPVKNPPVAISTTKPFPHHQCCFQSQITHIVPSVDAKHHSADPKHYLVDAKHCSVGAKHCSVDAKHYSADAKHYLVVAKHCSADAKNCSADAKNCLGDTKHYLVDANNPTLPISIHFFKRFLRIKNNPPENITLHHVTSGLYVLSRKQVALKFFACPSLLERGWGEVYY